MDSNKPLGIDFETLDIGNYQFVGMRGAPPSEKVVVMIPKVELTRTEALVHAAWLVVLAEQESGEFERVLEKVRST